MRAMKSLLSVFLVLTAGVFFAGNTLAANPNPPNTPYLLSGTPITITGIVQSVPYPPSQGIQIDTGDEVVTVYGIGPIWFWQQNGVPYPTVGEDIVVDGYEITYVDGTQRIVATQVTISGQTIVLRGDDGRPQWRGGPNSVSKNTAVGSGRMRGRGKGSCIMCPYNN